MKKVIVFTNKPTLAQLASAAMIEREIGADLVLRFNQKEKPAIIELRPNTLYFDAIQLSQVSLSD